MRTLFLWSAFVLLVLGASAFVFRGGKPMVKPEQPTAPEPVAPPEGLAKATFGSGCFWCTEAVFLQLKGVQTVISGYTGGSVKNPTYEQVCAGTTGHAEAIQVTYDPKVISYEELLGSSGRRMTRPRKIARETTSGPSIARRSFTIPTSRSAWRNTTRRSSTRPGCSRIQSSRRSSRPASSIVRRRITKIILRRTRTSLTAGRSSGRSSIR
jgi:hypothetical protein